MLLVILLLFLCSNACICQSYLSYEEEMENAVLVDTITAVDRDVVFISDEGRDLNFDSTTNMWNGITHYTTQDLETTRLKTLRYQVYIIDLSKNTTVPEALNMMFIARDLNPWSFLIIFVKTVTQETGIRNRMLKRPYYFETYILSSQTPGFAVFELCAYCNFGKNMINQINTWSSKRGYHSHFRLQSSFKGSFFGYTLRVGCVPVGGAFNAHPQPDGTTTYSGREWDMFQVAGQKLNFSVEIVVPLDEAFGAKVIENGKERFTGVVGDVKAGRSDIGAGIITPTPLRREAIDNINIFNMDATRLLSIRPTSSPNWQSFIRCFSRDLWIGFFVSLAAVTFAGWGIMRRESDESLFDSFLNMVSIFCWEDIPLIYKRHHNIRIVLGIWMVACTVLGAAYAGALLSKILTPSLDRLPIEDLDESIAVWMTFRGTYLAHLFDHRPEVAKRLVPKSSKKEMMEITMKNPLDHAILGIESLSKSMANRYFQDPWRGHPWYLSKRSYIPDIHSWLVPKGAPYQNALDLAVLDMIAGGFLKAFEEKVNEADRVAGRQKYLGTYTPPKPLVIPLAYAHVEGMFNILFGGYVIGALFCAGETIHARFFSKRKKAERAGKKIKSKWAE